MTPPRLAHKLLTSFLRDDLLEEVEGDLNEKFRADLKKRSLFRAKLGYWRQLFNYMRPFAVRKARLLRLNDYDMFQNYLKIGFRNILKSKIFSFINVSGMAISMAIFFIIALYIQDERKFDKHIEDYHLKFRVYNEHFDDDGTTKKGAMVPPMIAPTLAAEYPQVEYYCRFLNFNEKPLFKVGDKTFTEDKGGLADPDIFRMFSLHVLEGDSRTALTEPNTIAINQTLKDKYFGNQDALDQDIEIFDHNFKVTAVFEDIPTHSHFQGNYFISIPGSIPEERMQAWGWNQFHTYIKLRPGSDPGELELKLKGFAERNAWPVTKPNGGYYIPHLMPIEKVHLYAYDQLWDIAVRGNINTLYILTGIAAFILVIAILNFVNLSTARAINRAKEVGIRKVVGAFRGQVVSQFVSESVIIAFIALAIALFLALLVLPYVNAFTEKSIPGNIFIRPDVALGILGFGLGVGFLAGIYPAVFISNQKPSHILTGKKSSRTGRSLLRQGLVVFQFILSFFLIIASFVVTEQHRFMRNTDIGFDKRNVIVLPIRGDMSKNLETTKMAFSGDPNVISATMGYGLPGEAFAGDAIVDKATGKTWHINMLTADHDYIRTLGLEIIAGRDFSKEIESDERHAFVLSEAAAKMLGYRNPEEALNHEITWPRWDSPDSVKEGRVIGIVRDVQLNSMRDNIAPLIIHVYPFAYSTLVLRTTGRDVPATIRNLEETWKRFNSEWPFEYRFLDENFDRMYKAEEKLAVLFGIFTGFTILVACLGLFGLVVYSTHQRYKEVSIRKVLGASERAVMFLLARNYVLLVAIAFLIAAPLSYYAASEWLQSFAFRIEITPALFAKAGLLITCICLLTVGIQSFKATRANPVDALKEQ